MTPLILALVALPLEAIPDTGWAFDPPWPWTPERIYWGLEGPSNSGHCVEVCFYIDGREMGCSPMMKESDGMEICKEKMARTEGFEMAHNMMNDIAQKQIAALEEAIAKVEGMDSVKKSSKRGRESIAILRAQIHQTVELLNAFQAVLNGTPQEAKPDVEE